MIIRGRGCYDYSHIRGPPSCAIVGSDEDGGMTARSTSHPFHQHQLTKVDTRQIYAFCEARWRCDCCQRHLNGTLEGEITAYHCHQCEFDLCEQCYQGSLHPFHRHYLQPAKPTICYPQTGGQWRCDACQRVFSRLTSQVG